MPSLSLMLVHLRGGSTAGEVPPEPSSKNPPLNPSFHPTSFSLPRLTAHSPCVLSRSKRTAGRQEQAMLCFLVLTKVLGDVPDWNDACLTQPWPIKRAIIVEMPKLALFSASFLRFETNPFP